MTLIELMAVVVIIGVFAALAAPAIAGQVADRHVTRAAEDISGLFRVARSRSAASGAAHSVCVTHSGSGATATLRLELRAAVDPTNLIWGAPVTSCMSPLWSNADSKLLAAVDLSAGDYANKGIAGVQTDPSVDCYCTTPGGTPWYRQNGVWVHPTGWMYAEFQLRRYDLALVQRGATRLVRLGPTGAPRVDVQ